MPNADGFPRVCGDKPRALRKPVFIAPHTAGSSDGDIDDRPQVQVWRDNRKEEN